MITEVKDSPIELPIDPYAKENKPLIIPAHVLQAMETCFLIPTPGRLLVLRDGFHYSGSLHIPDTAKSRPTTGYVIAVPPTGELNFWLGRRLLFAPMSGTDLK